MPDRVIIVFARPELAERLVAGVPAAARAARAVQLAGFGACRIAAGSGWRPSDHLRAEVTRLAGGCVVEFAAADTAVVPDEQTLVLRGVAMPDVPMIVDLCAKGGEREWGALAFGPRVAEELTRLSHDDTLASSRLDAAGVAIVHATGKAGDGIISRYINRPISRTISTALLRIPGIRPIHATLGTGFLAAAMFAALVTGTRSGQVWGALLFQAASIFDGVDGEVARATFHTSNKGAMLDSVVDAITNLAFILGLALNLAMLGQSPTAEFGMAGLVLLGCGLALIGRQSARSGGPFSFDAIKHHYRDRARGQPSPLLRAVTFITSRDFFALAFAVAIVFGFSGLILELFALAALLWFIAVVRAITAPRL